MIDCNVLDYFKDQSDYAYGIQVYSDQVLVLSDDRMAV